MKDNILIELIYSMIDGEASEVERQTLFNALQQNPELQLEFQNALNINNAGKSFAASTEVPLNLTNKLFNKSGLLYTGTDLLKHTTNVSSGIGKVASAQGLWSGFGKIVFSKFGIGFLGVLLGGLLGITIYNNFGNDSSSSNQSNVNLNKTANPSVVSANNSANEEKIPEIQKSDNYKVIIKYIEKEVDRNIPSETDDLLTSDEGLEEQESINKIEEKFNPIQLSDINQEKKYFLDNMKNYSKTQSFSLINHIDFIPDFHLFTNDVTNFHVEINNALFWNMPKETVSPDEIAKFHNLNVFLYYALNNYLSVGIGVRQETFYVKYNTTDDLSREFIYEQQPNLTNYEVSLRYYPYNFKIFEPIIQLNLGGGRFGYTYRFGIGSEIKLYDDLAFTFLLEYATLSYQHESNISKASKVGINYGINYNF